MIPDLKTLFSNLLAASARAKAVALLSAVALIAVLSIGGYFAGQPHFVLLYSALGDVENAAIQKALAEGDVRFRVSQPPAPFVVYVEEGDYYPAQNLVARSGALDRPPAGIATSEGGAASVFLSSKEREQGVMKREWQEMERQLCALDFVSEAMVTTSMPDPSPLKKSKPMTASVMLHVKGGTQLTSEQARMVASLVRFRFDIPPENLVISDHTGHSLYDPAMLADPTADSRSLMQQSTDYDRDMSEKANQALVFAFGSGKAHVTVTSEWDYDQSTSIEELVDPSQRVAVSEESQSSKTPQLGSPGQGGPAGISSNLIDDTLGSGEAASATGESSEAVATTKQDSKRYDASRSTLHTIHSVPTLKRLSVSLFLDEALSDRKAELESIVKAAVGFVSSPERQDQIMSIVTPLAQAQSAVEEGDGAAPGADGSSSGLSPMVELLIERGIEVVAALAFLILLFKSLKGSGAKGSLMPERSPEEPQMDLELLARARVEELVKSDPERVSEILSRWASEEGVLTKAGR